jgi:hypothetical protein
LGAGCTGGQTGGEGTGEVPGSASQCDVQSTPLAFDAVTPLGPTAEQLIAPLLASHRSALLWRANTDPVTLAPEQGESSIELVLSYAGGNVNWLHFVEPPRSDASSGNGATTTEGATTGVGLGSANGPGAMPGDPIADPTAPAGEAVTKYPDAGVPSLSPCPSDRLEVDVLVLLRTGGGALDEAFMAKLRVSSVDAGTLDRELSLAALAGSLAVSAPPGISPRSLFLSASWDTTGFHGTLEGAITLQSGSGDQGVVGSGLIQYAVWPPPDDVASP